MQRTAYFSSYFYVYLDFWEKNNKMLLKLKIQWLIKAIPLSFLQFLLSFFCDLKGENELYSFFDVEEKQFWIFEEKGSIAGWLNLYVLMYILYFGSVPAHYYQPFKWKSHLFWGGITL